MRFKTILLLIVLVIVINIIFLKINKNSLEKQLAVRKLGNIGTHELANGRDLSDRLMDNEIITDSRRNAITNAVEIVEPSVVSVNVIKTQIVRKYMNPFENPFFGFFDYLPYKREVQSIGSGIIFTPDGYIITNEHVVEGATQIKVILTDARQFEAELVGLDTRHDVAILKINGEDLPHAKLGTSSDLIIGEWAIALGNPYAYLIKDSKPSVSVGVISAVNRNFAENGENKIYKGMIQTDSAINPGNSGGPLVNIYGEIIGINSFIFSESGGSVGIGFAIPVDRVKEIAEEIIHYGKIREAWFGFKIQDINQMIAGHLGLSSLDGVIISYIEKNSPADKANLEVGDIITKINETTIKTSDDAEIAVSDIGVNESVKLTIMRDSKEKEIKLTTGEYK